MFETKLGGKAKSACSAMTDIPTQQPSYNVYDTSKGNRRSKDETYQNLAKPVSERSEEEHELDTMSNVPTQQSPQLYQPLQGDRCSSDDIFEDLTKLSLARAENELDSMTNVHTQHNTRRSLEPIQGDDDENNQGMTKKEAELDNMKAAMKKMKIVSVATVIVNIVLLFVVIITVILGNVQSQSQFGQIALTQDNISMQINAIINNNISKLELAIHDNNIIISQISSQLNAIINNNISKLELATHIIISQVNAAKSNAISVQTQVDILQTQVAHLQTQVSDIHPCGPGEWRQVAYLNMGDPTQQCPSAWREYNTSGIRACGRPSTSGASCAATTYTINFQYSRVCGRVVGYQYGSPDGFLWGNLNQRYVDGVSITRGSPRQHVWTYAAGLTDSSSDHTDENCPCSSSPGSGAPSFVGYNYYCESGNPSSIWSNQLYLSDKLWDGKQCEGGCCIIDTPPWFSEQLSTTTSDDIEVRICGDEGTSNEDTPVELIEIYVAL